MKRTDYRLKIENSGKGFEVLRVANLIIDVAKRNDVALTNFKLQQILFFLQGFYLHEYGERLINGHFSKWQHGLAEKEAYDYFKSNGSFWLTDEAFDFSAEDLKAIDIPPLNAEDIGNERLTKLEATLAEMLKIPAWKLAKMASNSADCSDDEIQACYVRNFGSRQWQTNNL